MSKVIVTLQDDTEVEFDENTFGHQIGNGSVQIMLLNGGQEVFNNFKQVSVIPNEEEQASFEKQIKAAEAKAKEAERAREQAREAARKEQEAANDNKDTGEQLAN